MKIRFILSAVVGLIAIHGQSLSAGEFLPPDRSIAQAVDHYIDEELSERGVSPAEQTNDANLIRRTTLDLAGRIPTLAETHAYINSTDENKREQLIDRLLAAPDFVRQQVNEFNTLLMFGSGRDLRNYLTKAFTENRSWDKMFREMLTGDQNDEQQREATQFVRARAKDLDNLANQASVTFFGINVSCAQCHDHPLVGEWTQDHFYGMKSFFSRTFENGDFIGERDYGVVKYETTGGEERTARLMFLSGTVVDEPESTEPNGDEQKQEKKRLEELKKKKQPPPAPKFSRRSQLVEVALRPNENILFAKAIVNRIWYRLYGYGIVMPIDQMHPENPPSHPQLLDWLAGDLIDHNYDLRRLIRGLVATKAYSRSSRWASEERPSRSLFAVANVRTLTPHQYAASLKFASTNPEVFSAEMKPDAVQSRIAGIQNASNGLASLFEQPQDDFQVSVTEALLLSNNDRIMNDLVRDAGDTLVGKLKNIEDNKEVAQAAIWNVYSRAPEGEEVEALMNYLASRQDRRNEAIRQVVWALLASSECRFNY